VPRIVLAHYPDQVRFVSHTAKPDVMLTGHTHGGQICLPGGRALMTHDYLPKRMARGSHRFGPTLLIVNRGFGWTKFPVRVFCPAQVIELRLLNAMIT
jgi:predicted MPP superfamily phosphohydrolase